MSRPPAPFMSSTWLHEQAMTTADAARAVSDDAELSAYLYETAARFEQMALDRIPESRPRTRAILTESRDALRARSTTGLDLP